MGSTQNFGLFPVKGTAEGAFSTVETAFRKNFSDCLEVGASISVYHKGRQVVDLWGGLADKEQNIPWGRDTLGILASPTKTLATGAVLNLVEKGVLKLDDRLTDLWPEFGQRGKSEITLRMILSQRSGVVCLDHAPVTSEGLKKHWPITHSIERAVPSWSPGTDFGYHAMTYGHILSEIVLRSTNMTIGTYFAKEIAKPLNLHCYIGHAGSSRSHLATMYESKAEQVMDGADPGNSNRMLAALRNQSSLTYRATVASMALDEEPDPEVENASYDGLSSASSLSRFFASLVGRVDGVRTIGPGLLHEMNSIQSTGHCRVLLLPATWGLGVMLADGPTFPASAGLSNSFGIGGANGNFVFADPTLELSFAYVQNSGSSQIGALDEKQVRLIEATISAAERS